MMTRGILGLAAAIVAAFAFLPGSDHGARANELPSSRLTDTENFAPQPARRWRAYTRRAKYQDYKVYAISADGRAYGMAWSFLSPEWAAATALQRCDENRNEDTPDCAIFAIGGDVVASRPVAPLFARYADRLRRKYGPAPVAGKPVSERKMTTHITYRSFSGKTRWGTDFKLRFRKDEAQFEQGWIAGVMGKGQLGVARWTVVEGRLCLHLSENGADPLCYQVTEIGDDVYALVDARGDRIATLTP